MKNMKLSLFIILSVCSGIIWGKTYEKIVLKNGSELEGYISVQRPGKDVVFVAEKAMVFLSSDQLQSMVDHEFDLTSLSTQWKEWAKINQSVIKIRNNKEFLTLSDLVISDKKMLESDTVSANTDSTLLAFEKPVKKKINWNVVPRKVRILEKGAVIKYLDYSSNSYYLDWNDIETIKRDKRSKVDLNGLIDAVKLRSGEMMEGQIIEQTPGKQIRLLKDDGIVEVIDSKQIVLQRKIKLNPEQSLLEQSPLIDCVQKQDGQCLKGIVVEQDYGIKKEPGFLLIQTFTGDTKKVELKDIQEIRKEINPEYKEKKDILLNKGELFVNRKPVTNAIVEEADDLVTVLPESVPVVLSLDSLQQGLIVEAHFEKEYDAEGWILLPVSSKLVNKKESRNGFTYKEMVTNGIHYISKETSVNGTTRLVYPLTTPGYYVIYAVKGKRVILCLVK